MTKQEEIRWETKAGIRARLPKHPGFDINAIAEDVTEYVFQHLHSQRVVIKVEREHNVSHDSSCPCDTCSIVRAINAGYVAVEPLIKEG